MTTHPTPPASPSPAEAVEVRKRRETRMVMRLPRMTPHMPQSDAVERESPSRRFGAAHLLCLRRRDHREAHSRRRQRNPAVDAQTATQEVSAIPEE